MSDDLPFSIFRLFVICSVLSSFYVYVVHSTNSIATKVESTFPSECIDGDGNSYSHLQNWTTSAGSCDRHTCFNVIKENRSWELSYTCDTSATVFDETNCVYVSNSSLSFPECCPQLHCSVGVLPNNTPAVNLSACSDLSPSFACEYWKNTTQCTGNSNSIIAYLYNLTLEYCRLTCGYCTV